MNDSLPCLVIRRFWLTAAMLLFASGAGAQDTVERNVRAAPGKDARVAVYTDIKPDCTSGPLPTIKLASPPAHGGGDYQARHPQGHQLQAMPGD